MALGNAELRRRLVDAWSRALRRMTVAAWPLLQRTAAATLAWVLAQQLMATDVIVEHDPFFAPMAAVIALNASLGERGLNALRLLLGVVVGIMAGEIAVADGLGLTAQALERADDAVAEWAMSSLRGLRDRLAEVDHTTGQQPGRPPLSGLAVTEDAGGAREGERRPPRSAWR